MTDEIGIFTPEQARLIWHDYQSRQQLQPHAQKNYPQRRDEYQVDTHRVFVKNTETETIPAYACMRITGVEVVADRTAVTVEKPTDTAGEFLFNGPYPIYPAAPADWETPATTGVGWAFRYGVVIMLGDEPTAAGVAYLPIVGEWEIEEGAGPFIVFGRHDIGETALIGRIGSSGGGDGNSFLFQVVSSDSSIRRALAQIETRTFTGPAYGSTLDDTVVYVYDRMGCLLNEPNVDLTGRWGRAELFIWDSQVYPTWFTAGTEPEKIWLVTNLCCPQTSCS